jgi:hypothetical protein
MPANIIKSWSKKYDIPEKEMEKKWKEAVKITEEEFSIKEEEFGDSEFAYVTGVLKNMLGIKESKSNPIEVFLNSSYSAKQYIELITSSSTGTINSISFTSLPNQNLSPDNEIEIIDGTVIDMEDLDDVVKPKRKSMQDIVDTEYTDDYADEEDDDNDYIDDSYYDVDKFLGAE